MEDEHHAQSEKGAALERFFRRPGVIVRMACRESRWRSRFIATFVLIFGGVLSAPLSLRRHPAANQSPASAEHTAFTLGKIAIAEPAMPFRTGESLNYRVAWAIFPNAASLQLNVVERRNLLGWQTWHFRAVAHSVAPARTFFAVDDQFDSYTDAATLESHQYEMYLNEMGSRETDVMHFVAPGQSNRGSVAPVIVQPGTRDPLGAFYTLRSVDWQRTPEIQFPAYDGSDLYEIRARQESASDPAAVDAGNFQASKISIHLFEHGKEVRRTSFLLWLAHDAARTPVLLLAEMPLGSVRVELTRTPK